MAFERCVRTLIFCTRRTTYGQQCGGAYKHRPFPEFAGHFSSPVRRLRDPWTPPRLNEVFIWGTGGRRRDGRRMDAAETRTCHSSSLAECLANHTTILGSCVVLSCQDSDVFRELKAQCHSADTRFASWAATLAVARARSNLQRRHWPRVWRIGSASQRPLPERSRPSNVHPRASANGRSWPKAGIRPSPVRRPSAANFGSRPLPHLHLARNHPLAVHACHPKPPVGTCLLIHLADRLKALLGLWSGAFACTGNANSSTLFRTAPIYHSNAGPGQGFHARPPSTHRSPLSSPSGSKK
ncbi:hypothetical protein B0G69_4218 [Paraburkholderia sp. RAU2J]|nr:hypothetical protein B0G69_4218 [Paraburkholderia sp. RAU2J]